MTSTVTRGSHAWMVNIRIYVEVEKQIVVCNPVRCHSRRVCLMLNQSLLSVAVVKYYSLKLNSILILLLLIIVIASHEYSLKIVSAFVVTLKHPSATDTTVLLSLCCGCGGS